MRGHGLFAITDALANHEGAHQTRHSGVDMHHGTAGKVQRAHLPQITAFGVHGVHDFFAGVSVRAHPEPDHVRDRGVAESEPQHAEHQHRRELDALCKRAHDQRAGNRRKAGLEGCKHDLRDVHAFAEGGRGCEGARRVVPNAFHQHPVKAAKEGPALGKGNAVAVNKPQHHDQREGHHDLHQHREHVFAAHQAAIEQGQARHGHHDHQQGGGHHPGGIAFVGYRCSGGRVSSRRL